MYSVVFIYIFIVFSMSLLFNMIEVNLKLVLSIYLMLIFLSYICCYGCMFILYCENVFLMYCNVGSFVCNVYFKGIIFILFVIFNIFV